jgi:hypothetical protein
VVGIRISRTPRCAVAAANPAAHGGEEGVTAETGSLDGAVEHQHPVVFILDPLSPRDSPRWSGKRNSVLLAISLDVSKQLGMMAMDSLIDDEQYLARAGGRG